MRYLDRIKTDAPINADNALILGTALHTGIERDVEAALRQYSFSYPIITDEHIAEMIKLETVIPMAKEALPPGGQFEVPIRSPDFIGFIDYLVPMGWCAKESPYNRWGEDVDIFDLYDFKYSNNVEHYQESAQLHLYKYFWEKQHPGKKIRDMYFLFAPKVSVKQGQEESVFAYRQRIAHELDRVAVRTMFVRYDPGKVIDWLLKVKSTFEAKDFPPTKSYLCRYCDFQEYCEKGWDYFMQLPENKRRNIEAVTKRTIWIYGAPFSGKTTFANDFPDPLMLNTDGNYKFVDAPVLPIKDEVTVEGRRTKRKLAWEIFKEAVTELEKKENTFKTIIVDLLEDAYEYCRRYMYQQMGITHESDDSFKAWDKVRGEFLSTMKRLMNMDYENIILISHEDTTRDLTRKTGDKISSIKPNIQDKVAGKVAGMVDVVARVVSDDGKRTFNFKSDEVIFGGGRLHVDETAIPLSVEALFAVYDDANKGKGKSASVEDKPTTGRRRAVKRDDAPAEEVPANEPESAPNDESPDTLPKCPDAERIFAQNRESNGEIPLCPKIDAGYQCHRENGPEGCPLLNTPAPEADPAPDTADAEPPRRRRKARG